MGRSRITNILMYSHDTYGLGHIRRTLAIASQLRGPHTNILILTGSPIAGRFSFPEHVDFVRIPGMIKKTNEEYQPLSIKINVKQALDLRQKIIAATAKAFMPHIFIVDKEPLGLKKEVYPTLRWLKKALPRTRTILGLRDILDDGPVIRRDWEEKGVYGVLEELYDEIWVYGQKAFYDPAVEYAMPESVSRRMVYTGYIPRTVPDQEMVTRARKRQGLKNGDQLVVVTTGGGGDGYFVMDGFLAMLENWPGPIPFKGVLVSGPFLPRREREEIFARGRRFGLKTYQFHPHMEELIAAADLVVSMGGYNTLCEILSQHTIPLIIPREHPRREQLIRARVFAGQRLGDYLPAGEFTPARMREKVMAILENPAPFREAIAGFRLEGLEVMRQRLLHFTGDCHD